MSPKGTPPVSPARLIQDEQEEEDVVLDADDILEAYDVPENQEDPEELQKTLEDNSLHTLDQHSGKSVFSCAFHPKYPDQPLVATGGEDDKLLVTDVSSGQIVLKCEMFKDSVTFVRFNSDGTFLAGADMSGIIKVWKVTTREMIWEFETGDITWMGWHSGANVLFATTADSELWMWKIPSGDSKIFTGNGERAETGTLLPDGRRFLVGYADGTLRLFDLKSGNTLHNFVGISAHDLSVSSLSAKEDNILICSGGEEGEIKLFNSQSGKKLGTFACNVRPHSDTPSEKTVEKVSVESIVFSNPEKNLLFAGTLDGKLLSWDLSTQRQRHEVDVSNGIVKMAWRNSHQDQLLVATLEGTVRLVDFKASESNDFLILECSGHVKPILDFAQSMNGQYVVTSSDDGICKIFDMTKLLSTSEGMEIRKIRKWLYMNLRDSSASNLKQLEESLLTIQPK